MGGYLPGRFCPADAPRNPPLNASSRRSLKSSVVSGAPEAAAEAVPAHTASANTAAPVVSAPAAPAPLAPAR
ncbi:hypothetical protein [Rothia dentocariosa]|uniref:hypothetical protein n=1 Tax=Rothia dentocariosa TaxID=2047 RepID=UPI0024922A86|nr:hypothetical protein [Rothia dentocariosa]